MQLSELQTLFKGRTRSTIKSTLLVFIEEYITQILPALLNCLLSYISMCVFCMHGVHVCGWVFGTCIYLCTQNIYPDCSCSPVLSPHTSLCASLFLYIPMYQCISHRIVALICVQNTLECTKHLGGLTCVHRMYIARLLPGLLHCLLYTSLGVYAFACIKRRWGWGVDVCLTCVRRRIYTPTAPCSPARSPHTSD